MRSVHWTCDNYCGKPGSDVVSAEGRPNGWFEISVSSHRRAYLACTGECLAELAWKVSQGNIRLGVKVKVGALVDDAATVTPWHVPYEWDTDLSPGPRPEDRYVYVHERHHEGGPSIVIAVYDELPSDGRYREVSRGLYELDLPAASYPRETIKRMRVLHAS